MPVANLHLLHISPALPLHNALQTLSRADPAPLTLSVPVRWMITPNALSNSSPSPLLRVPWSILLITLASDLPEPIKINLITHYHVRVGVPSRLINDFKSKNATLLHPKPSDVPALTGSLDSPRFGKTSQTIELTPDLLQWIKSTEAGTASGSWQTGAISMLNFLAFKPGAEFKESYLRYGKAFGENIGKKRGGNAKLVGNVIYDSKDTSGSPSAAQEAKEWSGVARIGDNTSDGGDASAQDRKWDEFALAHYPSLKHFADMVGSEDYQAVNLKDRVPALADTCILFTSELLVEEILSAGGKAKL